MQTAGWTSPQSGTSTSTGPCDSTFCLLCSIPVPDTNCVLRCLLAPRSKHDPYTLRLLEGEELQDTLEHLSSCSNYTKVTFLPYLSVSNTPLPQLMLCHTMRVAVPTVWPPIFIGAGQKGKLDWLGDEVGLAHSSVSDILEKVVVEEGPVTLVENITIVRKNQSTIFLGPSLTLPGKTFKKVEIKKTSKRMFLDVKENTKEDEGVELNTFDEMMAKRHEELEDEERCEEEEVEEQEEMEEQKAKKEENKKTAAGPEDDAEERRRRIRQRRRAGE